MKNTIKLEIHEKIQKITMEISLPLKITLSAVNKWLGKKVKGLDIGSDNAFFSLFLSSTQNEWLSMPVNEPTLNIIKAHGKDASLFTPPPLPFPDKSFDVIVLFNDILNQHAIPSLNIIMEIHRILKTNGTLIFISRRKKKMTPLALFSKWNKNTGLTEFELFKLLKDGFDVHELSSFSRFYVELVDFMAKRLLQDLFETHTDYPSLQIKLWKFIYWVAYQLDFFIFFTKGHIMVAKAKRRMWVPRTLPVLSNGRTLSETVLTRIPF